MFALEACAILWRGAEVQGGRLDSSTHTRKSLLPRWMIVECLTEGHSTRTVDFGFGYGGAKHCVAHGRHVGTSAVDFRQDCLKSSARLDQLTLVSNLDLAQGKAACTDTGLLERAVDGVAFDPWRREVDGKGADPAHITNLTALGKNNRNLGVTSIDNPGFLTAQPPTPIDFRGLGRDGCKIRSCTGFGQGGAAT